MNAQCYRVIFNKARGMLMVVSEAARSQGKTSNPSEGGSAVSQITGGSQTATQINGYYQGGLLSNLRAQLLLALGLATILSTSVSHSAHADATNIVADRNAAANNQAAILQSSSGKTQVNIQTPSKAGVSRNVFSKFDVGADGAILNNSRKNAQTQLAGWVEGNPYLARGEARVILNEVNSNDPSRLSGYTEIAGGRAELVIANPAGITCAGCGFINASRTTLTTGQALMDQGKLTGFDVTGGKVRIDGDGMDSMGSDYTQIIAKTAEINAGIYAKNLDVITGSNQVSYEADAKNTVVTSKNAANNSNQTTGVALDVSALGAMYAGKIRLIGTDKGMGVTNAGSIIASSGGLQLDGSGNLINTGSLIANQGKVAIDTDGNTVTNSGTIASARDTATLNSSTLNNSGVISSRGILSLLQTGAIDNSGELSSGSFDVKAAALNNSGTLLQTGSGKLAIDTKNLSNRQGGIIGQDLYPSDSSTLPSVTPSKTPPTTANNGSSVGNDDNSQPSETPAPLPVITRDGNINVGNLTNTGSAAVKDKARTGVIYTNGAITVAADNVLNQDKASLAVSTLNIADNGSASNTDSRLQLDQIDWQLASFDNSKGQIITSGGIVLDVNNDIDNTQGTLASSGDIALNAKGDINNSAGLIQSSANLSTDSSNLNNRNGKLTSQGTMIINSRGDLTNSKGNISSAKDASINSKTINNDSGKITHAGQSATDDSRLSINADSINNTAGEILSVGAQTWQITKDIDNTAGVVQAKRFNIAAGDLNNTDGRLLAVATDTTQDSPSAQTQSQINVSGTINNAISNIKTKDTKTNTTESAKGVISSNTGSLDISARTLTNNKGQISSLKDLTVNTNMLTNSGSLYSQGNLDVANQGELTNSGSIAAQGNTTVNTGSLTQSATGQLIAGLIPTGGFSKTDSNLTVNSTGNQVNAGTNIATGNIKIEGSQLDLTSSRNQSSTLSLTANAGDIRLDKASTNVADMARFDTIGTLSNNSGVLQAGQFDWQVGALSNTAGTVNQTGNQAFNLVTNGPINNQKGFIGGNAASLNIDTKGELNNTEGTIVHSGQESTNITANQLNNTKGKIVSTQALTTTISGDLDNTEGTIQGKSLTAQAKTLTNNNGQLISQSGDLSLVADSINNQGDNAYIQSGNGLVVDSQQLTNSDSATIMAKGDAVIGASQTLNNKTDAVIASDKDMVLQTDTLSNTAQIAAIKQNLTINATSIDNQNDGQISAAGDTLITTSQGVSNQGVIAANNQLNVQTDGAINNKAGALSGGAVGLSSGTDINNEGGLIAQTSADQALSINVKGTLNNQNTKTNTAQKVDKQTGILANGIADIRVGSVNNKSGAISAKQLTINTTSAEAVNNEKGLLQASEGLTVTANNSDALNNQGGQIVGDTVKLTVGDANRGRIDNNVAGSLIQAGTNAVITTGTLNNQDSQQDKDDKSQGIIASKNIDITANTINNQSGQLLANNKVTLTAANQVNSQAGSIQSNDIAITDANLTNRQLNVNNDSGRITAGNNTIIRSKYMSNTNGEILANERADINVINDISYGTNDVINAKAVALKTEGNFSNSGKLTGQERLEVTAANIDNQKGAELSSNGTTQLTANTNIDNRGLINGINTYLDAVNSINNYSNGRIYGDHVAIETKTLNNTPDVFTKTQVDTCVAGPGCLVEVTKEFNNLYGLSDEQIAYYKNDYPDFYNQLLIEKKAYYKVSFDPAPVIAARQRLDIGVETLNNNPNEARAGIFNADFNGQAKIISNGELHIGGSLDDNHQATGMATTVNNKGASIESVGDMSISTETLNNVNADFQKITEKGIGKEVTKWRFKNDKQNRLFDPEVLRKNSWDYYIKETDEKLGEDYNDYNYTETRYKDVVVASDAARIISGSDIYLTGSDFLNDKSIILAGENQEVHGKELIKESVDGLAGREFVIKDGQYQLKEVHSHALGSKKSLDDIGDPVPYTEIAINKNYQLPILNQDIDKTIIAYKDDDVADVRELDDIKSAIQTLTNDKLTATDKNSGTSVGASGLADASKLLEAFAKADDSNLTDEQKQQLQALLDAQKQGSKVNQAAIDDLVNSINNQITQTASEEIRSSNSSVNLPNSSLYGTNPDSSADYLIETDPAFANYKNWLSSDYMLDRLQLDPNITQKRLGDGYYEQQYIRDQIMMLTGRYYLEDYSSQDAQYQGLMDAGVTTAKTLNLRPGIALTDEQVAKLTTDIVWLVQQDVTLADGRSQKVLVPKVYTRQAVGQIDGTGSLIAANNLDMQLTGDLNNQGSIVGHRSLNINASNLTNENGGLIKGDYVQIGTKNNLNNLSATIGADSAMQLDVGGDFNNQSLTYSTSSVKGASSSTRTGISQIASIYVGDGLKGQVDKKGNALTTFTANVGGDTTFAAGRLDNQGGSSYLDTKGDAKFDAVNVGYQSNSIGDANNYFKQGESADIGSQLRSNDDVIIKAGNNISGTAVDINSSNGTVGIMAEGNVDFKEGRNKQNLSTANKTTSKGFLSKTTTQDRFDMQSDSAISSNIEGDKVIVEAGQDINFTAVNAISDRGTQLTAGRDVNILAAENTSSESSFSQTKKSGLFGTSGGLGFTIGKQQTDDSNAKTALTHTGSNVGAIDGNVIIDAGRNYQQTGSNIVAGMGADSNKDINATDRGNTVIRAQNINIDNTMDVYTNQSEQKFKQSGLTVAVSNSLVDSAKNIGNLVDAGGDTDSMRMKGMAGVAATLKTKALAKEATNAAKGLAGGINANSLKGAGNTRLQATIGSQKSQSNSTSYTEVNQGSSIDTNNLALIATGAGADSNINTNGSSLTVSNDALFQADNDFNVNGVAQNSNTRSNNKNSSTAIGAYASTGNGMGITASASRGKGYANSDSTTYANSEINVGGTTTFDIGHDVNIKGSVINTDRAQGAIGGDVNIESLQDTATYDSKQKNMGFNADLDLKGAGSSLSVNGGKTNLNADYKGVGEQSGIFANEADLITQGKGTFKGSVFVTSKEAQDNGNSNIVFKQGVTATDLKNTTSYDGDAIQAGISIGSTDNKPQASMNGIGYGTDSDSDSSITKGGVSGYNDPDGNLTADNRVALAGKLESVFDAEKVNEELGAQTQITQEFGKEAPKAVGDFASKREETLILNGNVEEAKKWGDGGAYRVALHTLVGAIATGSVEGALSSGTTAVSVPAVRKYLDNQGVDETTKSALLLGLSAGIGATVGGDTASTATSYTQTDNNYLRHNDIQALGEQINKALMNGNDAEVKKLLNEAIVRSDDLNRILKDENKVYIDSISDQPMAVIPADKIKNFLNGLNIPAKYQPKINTILKLQTIGESTYDANKNKLVGKNTAPVYLYPYQAGYGEVPESYNISREESKLLQKRDIRGANALAAIGSSPIAASTYGVSKLTGASDETAENVAIGTALVTNTVSSGKGATIATNKKGAVGVNKQNSPSNPISNTNNGRNKVESDRVVLAKRGTTGDWNKNLNPMLLSKRIMATYIELIQISV